MQRTAQGRTKRIAAASVDAPAVAAASPASTPAVAPGARPPRLPPTSAYRTLQLVGDAWVLRMLRDAFRGVRRFDDWRLALGMPRTVLSSRLARLTKGGILVRSDGNGTGQPEYRLTEAGLDLWSLLIAMWAWETRWAPNPGVQRMQMLHLDCGHMARPVPSCGSCGGEVSAYVTRPEPGPGAPATWTRRPARGSSGPGGYEGAVVFSTQTTRIMSDHWSSALIGQAYRGAHSVADFADALDLSHDVVRERLDQFVDLELLEPRPPRNAGGDVRYHLTAKGIDHFPVSLELIGWGDRWLSGPKGPPVVIRHAPCGHALGLEWRCSHCGGQLERRRIRLLNTGDTPEALPTST